jgi:hypothetical protein
MTTNGSTPPVDAWQVESVRVTAFPSEVVPVERISWWDDIVGVPPETVVSRPKTGQYQTQGEFEGRRLVLQIQPGRIDWNVSPTVQVAEEDPKIPLLGPFTDVIASLTKVVASWLPQAPPIKRVAFGAILVQPVENRRAGYVLIKKYLPGVAIDPDGSSDFFYQINRPRPSTTPIGDDLRINRLSKWSVQVAQRVTVTIDSGGIEGRAFAEEVACRLEVDINTAPDFSGVLPSEQLVPLLQEMTELGREIAQKGDVR